MDCPKCGADKVDIQLRKNQINVVWIILAILVFFLLVGYSTILSTAAVVFVLALGVVTTPTTQTIGLCKSCGFTFNPKTMRKMD